MSTKDLEVRHCRVLLAVHAHGGVGAAAQALGMAQSTVSETLLGLERILGAPITIRRPGREAALTPAAEALLPHARALVAAAEAALASVRSEAAIRLGTVESISSFLLPAPLREFRALWPQVDVRISIGLCEELRKRVERSELDAALTVESSARIGGDTRELAPAPLRLVVSPDHELARAKVRRGDLEARTFLLADADGAFNGLLRGWVTGGAPRLESAGSIDGVKRGVRSSDAIGVLPDYAVAEELGAGSLVALSVDVALPPVSLLLTVRGASSALESLLEQIGASVRA